MENKFKMSLKDSVRYVSDELVGLIESISKLEGIDADIPTISSICYGHTGSYTDVHGIIVINNIKTAWRFITNSLSNEHKADLNITYLKKIDDIIGAGIIDDCGELRDFPVRITGTDWMPEMVITEEYVKEELSKLTRENKSETEYCIEVLIRIMKLQLFPDGNKRVAQLMANALMLKYGVGIISIPVKYQDDFRKILREFYETDNMEEIKEFLYEYCIEGKENRRIGSEYYQEHK